MKNFTIYANEYLQQNIQAYYHADYIKYGHPGNPDYINDLKNTFNSFSKEKLENAINLLLPFLQADLSKFDKDLTVCVTPRSKAENTYDQKQLLFKKAVQYVIDKLGFEDGSNYIIRHTNTKTTHLNRSGYGGDGDMPYPGITKNTCHISHEIKGKNILLIDDLYTKTINIDEDVIQTLLNYGAKSVIFYSLGKTVYNN